MHAFKSNARASFSVLARTLCGASLLAVGLWGTAYADGGSDAAEARKACQKQGKAGSAAELKECCNDQILVGSIKEQKRLVALCAAPKDADKAAGDTTKSK